MDLPALTGDDPKQIALANLARDHYLPRIDYNRLLEGVTAMETAERNQAIIIRTIKRVQAISDATWWIELHLQPEVVLPGVVEEEYVAEYGEDYERLLRRVRIISAEVKGLEVMARSLTGLEIRGRCPAHCPPEEGVVLEGLVGYRWTPAWIVGGVAMARITEETRAILAGEAL